MHTSNIWKSHRLLIFAVWRLPVSILLCFCVSVGVGKIWRYCCTALLGKLHRFSPMRKCYKDSQPEFLMIDRLMTLELTLQKFWQQNSNIIHIPTILGWNKLHSVQPKHSLLAREVANSSSSLPALSSYFHFGRVWCKLAKRESRDWWIPNCVLGRQQMLHHRC